jgi:hypothetical protein
MNIKILMPNLFKLLSILVIFSFFALSTGENKSSTKEPQDDEYKCQGCYGIFKKNTFCYTHTFGSCDMVTHFDYAPKSGYVYCSKSCCSKKNK